MNKKLEQEISNLINKYDLNCSIDEFKDKVKWIRISTKESLSEDFIEEFRDYINWTAICWKQKLSENFIARNLDKADWPRISSYQAMSLNFVMRFKNKLVVNRVMNNKLVDNKTKIYLIKEFPHFKIINKRREFELDGLNG